MYNQLFKIGRRGQDGAAPRYRERPQGHHQPSARAAGPRPLHPRQVRPLALRGRHDLQEQRCSEKNSGGQFRLTWAQLPSFNDFLGRWFIKLIICGECFCALPKHNVDEHLLIFPFCQITEKITGSGPGPRNLNRFRNTWVKFLLINHDHTFFNLV